MHYSLNDGYVVYARINGVWRDTQKPLEITGLVLGSEGTEELLVYYDGDVYSVGRQPGTGIYPKGVEAIKGGRKDIMSETIYFEDVPFEFILSKIKKESGLGLAVVTGEMRTQGESDIGRVLIRLNKRTEAYPSISLKGDTVVLSAAPLGKLDYLVGRGVYVYSAKLTIREIPVKN